MKYRPPLPRFFHAAILAWIVISAGLAAASDRFSWSGGFGPPDGGGQGTNGPVRALALYQGAVVAGGDFTRAGAAGVAHVARWNGSSWQPLGSGLNGPVWSLFVRDSDLYAGGNFSHAGGVPTSHVARWDGSAWHPLGAGVDSTLLCFADYQGRLYVGGFFAHAGGTPAPGIAGWDGSSWSSLGAGLNSAAYGLLEFDGRLAVGGWFTRAGGAPAYRMAAWDGNSWSAPYDVMNGPVWGLAAAADPPPGTPLMIALGFFELSGSVQTSNISRWDGSIWRPLGAGLNALAICAAEFQGSLIAGGNFTLAGAHPALRVAEWDGTGWSSLGAGADGIVRTMVVQGGSLYIGGDFANAGGLPSSYLARLDGADPAGLPGGDAGDPSMGPAIGSSSGNREAVLGRVLRPRLQIAPTPGVYGRPLSIAGLMSPGVSGTLTLRDGAGRQLLSRKVNADTAGRMRLLWDGRNSTGEFVAPGIYWATLGDGVRTATVRIVLTH